MPLPQSVDADNGSIKPDRVDRVLFIQNAEEPNLVGGEDDGCIEPAAESSASTVRSSSAVSLETLGAAGTNMGCGLEGEHEGRVSGGSDGRDRTISAIEVGSEASGRRKSLLPLTSSFSSSTHQMGADIMSPPEVAEQSSHTRRCSTATFGNDHYDMPDPSIRKLAVRPLSYPPSESHPLSRTLHGEQADLGPANHQTSHISDPARHPSLSTSLPSNGPPLKTPTSAVPPSDPPSLNTSTSVDSISFPNTQSSNSSSDLLLLIAAHLLSTHAAELMKHSQRMHESSEAMQRMAKASLDWRDVLVLMTRQRGLLPEEELIRGEGEREDRLTPIPARPSVPRSGSQAHLDFPSLVSDSAKMDRQSQIRHKHTSLPTFLGASPIHEPPSLESSIPPPENTTTTQKIELVNLQSQKALMSVRDAC